MATMAAAALIEENLASEFVTQCAWCGSIMREGRPAAKMRPIVSTLGTRQVSHGICGRCFTALLASRGAAALKRANRPLW